MNSCFQNINRIEFIITYDCTGRCKHCSEGDHTFSGVHIDGKVAAKTVYDLCASYDIRSVMTFGGEPLMYADSVLEIHRAATKINVPKRQLITNGYFSNDKNNIMKMCEKLKLSGINDLLLSVDAFHQETIPTETVKIFAQCCKSLEIPIRISPAWLVSKEHINPYNNLTKELVKEFTLEGIDESDGNIVFPEGNAKIYLSEYFSSDKEYKNPYVENPKDIRTVSIEPDGSVFGKSIEKENILDILESFE